MVYGQLKYFENVLILLDFFANFKKTWKVSKLLNVIAMANTQKSNTTGLSPPQELLNNLLGHYQNGRFSAGEKLSVKITQDFPKHQFAWKVLGAILGAMAECLKQQMLIRQQSIVSRMPRPTTTWALRLKNWVIE